jgi:NifU-like protein involved in Fe-S cluster formation
MMINDVYNKRILELAANIERLRRLDAPDATATAVSRLCGSKVSVDICMSGDTVTDFGHEVKACALGQASSSLMARHVVGSSADELRQAEAADVCHAQGGRAIRRAANGPSSRFCCRCAASSPGTPRRC